METATVYNAHQALAWRDEEKPLKASVFYMFQVQFKPSISRVPFKNVTTMPSYSTAVCSNEI